MEEVVYILPRYFDFIVEKLKRRDWLVHSYNIDDSDDIYRPYNYLYNKDLHEVEYTVFLDLNIYQFLLNSVKKEIVKDDYKDAISLLLFCQIAKIEIDPTFAVYEKVNYMTENLTEILKDLELFYNINDSDAEHLFAYASGGCPNLEPPNRIKIDYKDMQQKLTRYSRLKEWDSLYLMILAITNKNLDSTKSREDKLKAFVRWSIKDFRRSLVAVVYALVLFSKKPIKRMMKYKVSASSKERKKCLTNMTWDLYILNQFFRKWTSKSDLHEHLFASNDKAFCELLRLAIDVQKTESFNHFHEYVSSSTIEFLNKQVVVPDESIKRVYNSKHWTPDHRTLLIEKYEKALLE